MGPTTRVTDLKGYVGLRAELLDIAIHASKVTIPKVAAAAKSPRSEDILGQILSMISVSRETMF